MKKIKLLIVDDHPIMRKGLKQIINDTPDLIVEEEACNAKEALEKAKKCIIDLVILDISLPDRNGLDVIKDLQIIKPDLPVIVLTMYTEQQLAISVLKAGASGFLNKDSMGDKLISAIRKVLSGKKYLSDNLAEELADNLNRRPHKKLHEILSEREFEVFHFIAQGKTIKEVGDILNISPKTISTYRTRIFEKMNMMKDSDIIFYAIKNKLIKP